MLAKKAVMFVLVSAAVVCSGGVYAGGIEDELAAIKARLKQLEQHIRAQDEALKEKERQILALASHASPDGQSRARGGWFPSFEIGGSVEVQASSSYPDSGDSSSDIVVATAEIGIAVQINDWMASEIILLYEEDDTDLEVDIATITVADPGGP